MWEPSDFIIRGQYCDESSLRSALELIRSQHGARYGLLLAHAEGTFFQSLLMVSHETSSEWRPFERTLLASRLSVPANLDRSMKISHGFEPIAPHLLLDFFSSTQAKAEIERRLLDQSLWCAVENSAGKSTTDPNREPVTITVIFSEPQKSLKAASIDQVHTMVNGTAAVDLFREARRSLRIDRFVAADFEQIDNASVGPPPQTNPVRVHPLDTLHDFAQRILEAALHLTRSSVGNIYLTDSASRDLILIAHERNVIPFPHIDYRDKKSVVAWVNRRARPLLINSISEFKRTHSEIGYLDVHASGSKPFAELAVPILLKHPEASRPAVLGVINVEKARGDKGVYNADDVIALQQLADRFVLLRSNSLLKLSAASLASLTRSNAVAGNQIANFGRTGNRHPSRRFGSIPSDLRRSRSALSSNLEEIYTLTRSSSVTIRLLSPDGRLATRFAAFPEARMNDRYRQLAITDAPGVQAWVFRTGKVCDLRDTLDPKELERYENLSSVLTARSHPRSELCVPLFVYGRMVGTMNLESMVPNAYSDMRPVVEAMAEQIALQLAMTRRSIEQEVFSCSASTTLNTHEILKAAKQLAEEQAADGSPLTVSLARSIGAEILACISAMVVRRETEQLTLDAIVSRSIDSNSLHQNVRFHGLPIPDQFAYDPVNTLALKMVFGELLRNAANAASKAREPFLLNIESGRRSLGGRIYDTLRISNSVLDQLHPRWADKLYRFPLVANAQDRLHMGTYIVGALLRSIGGDIYLDLSDPRRFASVLEIPEV